jgi:hypothetical protein
VEILAGTVRPFARFCRRPRLLDGCAIAVDPDIQLSGALQSHDCPSPIERLDVDFMGGLQRDYLVEDSGACFSACVAHNQKHRRKGRGKQAYRFLDLLVLAAGAALEYSLGHMKTQTLTAPIYLPFVETPTDAVQLGPEGESSPISPDTVCLKADAQAFVTNLIAPLFPGKAATITDESAVGVYHVQYGTDPRRQWGLLIDGESPNGPGFASYIKLLMLLSYAEGVGRPGHMIYVPAPGEPANDPTFQWIPDPPAPTPVNGVTLGQVFTLVAQYNAQPGVTAITIA